MDWVLDPANNQIRYREATDPLKCGVNGKDCPQDLFMFRSSDFASVYAAFKWDRTYAESICKSYIPANNTSQKFLKLENFDAWDPNSFSCVYDGSGTIRTTWGKVSNPSYDPNAEQNKDKSISLDVVAQKVIENAENDNLDAQFAVLAAATNILSEAENDDAKAKPIEDELENNTKCPSGIVRNGSCWICDKSQFMPITRATRDAKTATRGKSCKDVTDTAIKTANATLFRNLINARTQENACWSPPDPNHAIALVDAQNALSLCEN